MFSKIFDLQNKEDILDRTKNINWLDRWYMIDDR